jgi:hypothetical protein
MKTPYLRINVIAIVLLLIITSCTKVIDLKLNNDSEKLVIEGNVTNVPGMQVIKLNRNVSTSSTNNYPAVSGANVSVNDNLGNVFPFTEGPSGTYTSVNLIGASGNNYTLSVSAGGQSYTASSVMPVQVALDSVTAKDDDFNNSKHKKELTVHYKDPAGIQNQYRFVVTVNGVQIKRVFTFDDRFTDGRNTQQKIMQDNVDIYAGDTVKVEMQCIDKPIFTYWDTLMSQVESGPGGSVTPSNPPTNITPYTLGYFSAHTSQIKTIVIK